MHGWADRDGQPEVGIRLVRRRAGIAESGSRREGYSGRLANRVNEGTPISLRRPGSVNLAMTYSRTPAGVHYHRRLHA